MTHPIIGYPLAIASSSRGLTWLLLTYCGIHWRELIHLEQVLWLANRDLIYLVRLLECLRISYRLYKFYMAKGYEL
jgi:hypothetical protein